jgi:hypothetical protein
MYIQKSMNKFQGMSAPAQLSAEERQQIKENYLKKGIEKERQQKSFEDQRFDEIFGEGLRNAQAAERRKSAWMDLENSKRDPQKEFLKKKKAEEEEQEEKNRALYDRNLKNMSIIADINQKNRS